MGIDRETLAQVRQLLRPLATRIANIAARAVVQLVDDSTKLQLLQVGVLESETIDDAEHFQPYGFSSVPLPGAEAAMMFPDGDRGRPIALAVTDRRYRPTGGDPGQVTLYHYTGAKVTFTEDGDIVAEPASGREVRLGGSSASNAVVAEAALSDFMDALASAISANPGPIAAALGALQVTLQALNGSQGWKARTSRTKAE